MSITKEQIKDYAKSLGMDFCGVSGVDRLKTSPEGKHPCDVLPGCKSVIVVGVKLLDGIIQANFRALEDGRWDLKGLYGTYGYSTLPNFELTFVCYAMGRYIESNSDAYATPCSTGPMTNGAQISIRHAAVAAGLGEFGYLGIVLTPEYGPRNRFGVILTTLELEPDPMYSGPAICTKCNVCAKVCPTGALRMPGTHDLEHVEIGEKEYTYTKVVFPKCVKALTGMTKALGGREDYLLEKEPTMEDLAAASSKMPIESNGITHSNAWNCGRCQTYCPAGNWNERFNKNNLTKGAASMFMDEKL